MLQSDVLLLALVWAEGLLWFGFYLYFNCAWGVEKDVRCLLRMDETKERTEKD
jgi:hypothetical protein